MTTYQIIDQDEDDFDILDQETGEAEGTAADGPSIGLDAEEVLDFIIARPDDRFAFGEFEVGQESAISRMETVYGVFR